MKMRSVITAFFLVTCGCLPPLAYGLELGPPPKRTGSFVPPPKPSREATTTPLTVDTSNRLQVQALFNWVYKASVGVPIQWTGSIAGCHPGTTSQAYRDATILRVNYYRAMTGLPADVTLDPNWNAKCQAAALMMSAQGQLSHFPDPSWACYSEDGYEAASHSNLALGATGPDAIDGYMEDPGEYNYFVAHRRWILYPPQEVMGTGSVPESWVSGTRHYEANSLWVLYGFGQRPAQPEWVAWPPEGYVPYQVVYPRWSFSYHEANFSGTNVSMWKLGSPVSLTILDLDMNDIGYADNTIVWEPSGLPSGPPGADTTYTVRLSSVLTDGSPRTFEYDVTIINPDYPPPTVGITKMEALPGNVLSIAFVNSGTSLSGYQLQTATGLSGGGSWAGDPGAVITDLGGGLLEAVTTISPGATTRFYRIKGLP